MHTVNHLPNYTVIELRRYAIKKGEARNFARHFEEAFLGAFQQLGAIAVGEGIERDTPDSFTWLRGFEDMDSRATVNAAFYYGPLWKEHKQTMNGLMEDSDNVLLLRPLRPERDLRVLPAVNLVAEPQGAVGVIVLHVLGVNTDDSETLTRHADEIFSAYDTEGIRASGVLVTLKAANNFPQLPVRDDGPWLVWIGVLRDDDVFEQVFKPAAGRAESQLRDLGLLRGNPEVVAIEPSPRSRLRWLPTPLRLKNKA